MNTQKTLWPVAEALADERSVHRALKAFSEDPTGDNGTNVVRAVLEAQRLSYEATIDERVERATMRLLGKKCDPSPGINWECNRYWKVRRVRNLMRKIIEDVLGVRADEGGDADQ